MTGCWKRTVALLVISAAPSSGCSWAFMTKAPDVVAVPNYPVDCTTSRAAPILDTICSAYFVANGIYLATVTSCENASPGETCFSSGTKAGGIVLSAGLAVLCGFAAGSGYDRAARCQQVKELNAGCITGDARACQQLRPGWVPAPVTPPAPVPGVIAPFPPPTGPSKVPDTAPSPAGCTKDTDCKGDRVCDLGRCAEPTKN